MPRTCPHCAADLWDPGAAYCPECRDELPPASATQPGEAPAGDESPEWTAAAAPDDPAALFWRRLSEFTPRTYFTQSLIAANVAVFVLMGVSGVNVNNPSIPDLLRWGADYGPETLNGEWWRALTSAFVHLNVAHVAMNMVALWVGGRLVERLFGNAGFLLMYLLSGLGGSLASLWWHPDLVSAGASGAVFGVYGAILGLVRRQRDSVPPEVLGSLKWSGGAFLGYNLVFGLTVPNVDWAAHAGGAVTGYVCGLLMSRPLTPEGVAARPNRNLLTFAVGLTATAFGILCLSAFPPPTVEVERELQNCQQADDHAIRTYTAAWERCNRGEITEAALAEVLARDVLPGYRAARERLAALKGLPPEVAAHVEAVLHYMQLREEGWRLYAEGVREQDAAKVQKAVEAGRRADEAGKATESR